MNPHIEKLRATVAELEHALRGLMTDDHEARQKLEDALRETRAALNDETLSESQKRSLIERLEESVVKFEGTHPTLTLTLARLIDGLALMGI